MPILNEPVLKDIKVSFLYSCTLELVTSLHVITDPSHHSQCVEFIDAVNESISPKLKERIVSFGTKYAKWVYVMDIVDHLINEVDPSEPLIDDFDNTTSSLRDMPKTQFTYIFLGETLLGNEDIAIELLQNLHKIDSFDFSKLTESISWEDTKFFINHIDETKEEIVSIIQEYYESFFKDYWKKNGTYYKSAVKNEMKIFQESKPLNYILSLHDMLTYNNDTLMFRKETLFEVKPEEVKNIKIAFSIFTYPHLMFNISHMAATLTVYENFLMPDISINYDYIATSARVLGDPTRLTIIKLLLKSEATTKTLARLLNTTPAAVSQHLKVLREAGLVTTTRAKNNVFYTINKSAVINLITAQIQFLELSSNSDTIRIIQELLSNNN